MKITDHYETEKQRFLESCTQCGLCAEECPILPYTEIGGISAQEIQMEHHGKQTICCGSGAISWFPESCAQFREDRLKEAEKTGAEYLVTVCHYCGQTFASEEKRFDFSVTNYVNMVANAMGTYRDDKFKRYMLCGNLELILKDVNDYIHESPFEKERIIEVLQKVFVK